MTRQQLLSRISIDIQACIAFGAEMSRERYVEIELEKAL